MYLHTCLVIYVLIAHHIFKMLAMCYVTILLSLVSSLCNASNDMLEENQTMNNIPVSNSTKVFIALPLNSGSLHFDCEPDEVGSFETQPGKSLEWHVSDNEIVSCSVYWGHLTSFFQANYDQSGPVKPDFWIIKIDGFFHTIDHIHWERRAIWREKPII